MEIEKIQQALTDAGLDGWLFYDFHNRDPIAYRVLGMDFGKFTSRRLFYFIPAGGAPRPGARRRCRAGRCRRWRGAAARGSVRSARCPG